MGRRLVELTKTECHAFHVSHHLMRSVHGLLQEPLASVIKGHIKDTAVLRLAD